MRRRDVLAGAVGGLAGLAGCLGSSQEGQGAAPSAPESTPAGAAGTAEGADAVTVATADLGPDEATLSLTRRLFADRPCPTTGRDAPAVCTRRAHETLPVALAAEPPVVAGGGRRSTDPGTVTVRLYNAAGTAAGLEPPWRLRRLTDDGRWRPVGEGDDDGQTRVPARESHAWRFVQDPFVPVDDPAPEPTTVPDGEARAWRLPPGEYALIVSVTLPANGRLGPATPVDPGDRVDLVARFLFRGGSILLESP